MAAMTAMTAMTAMSICPLCTAQTETILATELRRGKGIVYYCKHCDLGFLVADPKPKDYYSGEYRDTVNHKAEGGATSPQELYDTYRMYQSDRLKIAFPYFATGKTILEIGASAGQFLGTIGDWFSRRCAIEPDPRCCAFMEQYGIETDTNFLRNSRFYHEKFDIVCSFQTLEHVENPVQFLEDVLHVMKPGGVAFIEVPNLHEPLRSVWGIPEYERFYFHGDHLFYFSALSLGIAMHKAGFKSASIRYTQDYSLLSHIHWLMNKTPQPTCHIGLGPVKFQGKDSGMASWLSHKLAALNEEYIQMLVDSGQTSNIMMILTN